MAGRSQKENAAVLALNIGILPLLVVLHVQLWIHSVRPVRMQILALLVLAEWLQLVNVAVLPTNIGILQLQLVLRAQL